MDAVSWGDIDVCFGVVIRTVECTETAPRKQRCEVAFVKRIRHLTSYSLRNSLSVKAVSYSQSGVREVGVEEYCIVLW